MANTAKPNIPISQQLLNANNRFNEKKDLRKTIDVDDGQGNTIIHDKAKKLDKEGLESLRINNPELFTYENMNMTNNKGETPLQLAMMTIEEQNIPSHEFIEYLINLGANPDIPDAKNRVLANDSQNKSIYNNTTNQRTIEKLNDNVKKNIKALTQLIEPEPKTTTAPPANTNVDFIKKIQDYYASISKSLFGKTAQSGGRRRNKRDRNIYNLTEEDDMVTDNNDSFVIGDNDKNRLVDDYDRENLDNKNNNNNNNYNNMFYGGASEDDMNTLSDIGTFNDYTIEDDNMMDNVNEDTNDDESVMLIGGENRNNRKTKSFNDSWDSDDFRFNSDSDSSFGDDTNVINDTNYDDVKTDVFDIDVGPDFTETETESRYERSNRFNPNVNYFDSDNTDDIIDEERYDTYSAIFNQNRPRNEKVDEIYRSFLQKIKDLLGVDDETARFYRSAIKINIEQNNAELRKRENDELKIKEMESIFESEAKLRATLDKIDMPAIKKYMEETREEAERRRAERNKLRDEKNKSRNGSQKKITDRPTSSKTTDRPTSKPNDKPNDKPTDKPKKSRKTTTTTEKIATSDKKPRPAKKFKVAESGYLQSEDIEFSSEY